MWARFNTQFVGLARAGPRRKEDARPCKEAFHSIRTPNQIYYDPTIPPPIEITAGPRTGQWLQERSRDTPTKGLVWFTQENELLEQVAGLSDERSITFSGRTRMSDETPPKIAVHRLCTPPAS